MHEIVTLQIGEQANYLGTQFWNIQESYFTDDSQRDAPVDHYVHFQPGIGADGSDTFTPRTLIYDFKRNFGTLRKVNELYESLGNDGDETSLSTAHRQPEIPLHPYQRALNEGVEPPPLRAEGIRFWSDFNRVFYHPRAMVQVYEDQLEPQQKAFAQWTDGESLFDAINSQADVLDEELRPLIEQCDQMQGMQILTGVDDGWGGFASRYLDAIRDELDKSAIFVCALNGPPPDNVARRGLSMANQARSLVSLANNASVYLPYTAAATNVPAELTSGSTHPWVTSAAQVIALESTLLPSRLDNVTTGRLNDLAAALTADSGQNVVESSFQLITDAPYEAQPGRAPPSPQGTECSLFPQSAQGAIALEGRVDVWRGPGCDENGEKERGSAHHSGPRLRFASQATFPILDSLPAIQTRSTGLEIRASLSKSTAVATWVSNLEAATRRRAAIDDREELVNGLREISQAYQDTSGESSGDED